MMSENNYTQHVWIYILQDKNEFSLAFQALLLAKARMRCPCPVQFRQ